jgi:hypothetical protein
MKKIYLLLFVLICFSCQTTKLPEGSDLLKFESNYWKEILIDKTNVTLKNDDRQKMLADLFQNYIEKRSKSELIDLLGDSDFEKFEIPESHLIYITGLERTSYFAIIDSEWLILVFDENGIFKEYRIVTD